MLVLQNKYMSAMSAAWYALTLKATECDVPSIDGSSVEALGGRSKLLPASSVYPLSSILVAFPLTVPLILINCMLPA